VQYCLDANIFITSWYIYYPEAVFHSLWKKLSSYCDKIILIKPVYDQIEPISPSDKNLSLHQKREKYPLRMWLLENEFKETFVENEVDELSLNLEKQYEIDNNVPSGADKVDITLIAYARIKRKIVVTYEGEQKQKPRKKSKYKIPLICKKENVECVSFVNMLEDIGIRI